MSEVGQARRAGVLKQGSTWGQVPTMTYKSALTIVICKTGSGLGPQIATTDSGTKAVHGDYTTVLL